METSQVNSDQAKLAAFRQGLRKIVFRNKVSAMLKGGVGLPVDNPSDWLKTLFPDAYRADFAAHHLDLLAWFWALESGMPPVNDEDALAIWARGGAKSQIVEGGVVMTGARATRKYVLYTCETQDQADDHVQNIGKMLESAAIATYYPALGKRKVGKFGNIQGWRRQRLWTDNGFVIDAMGLDSARRGAKVEEQRPDLIILDDIDGEDDTRVIGDKKLKLITKKILPTGAPELAVVAAQNLIYKDSVIAQIRDRRADCLSKRIESGPIPALRNFRYQKENGVYEISGEPTWVGQDLDACKRYVSKFGLESFKSECQHDTTAPTGAVFREWDERYHIITWTEFKAAYGERAVGPTGEGRIPAHWILGRALDAGTTVEHPSGCIWMARGGKGDPYHFRDTVFVYRELVLPEWPTPETLQITPQRVFDAIWQAELPYMEMGRMQMSYISHEKPDWANTALLDRPPAKRLRFTQWKPDRNAGIGPLQNYMQIIETDQPNPFRRDLMGRSRLVVIVADGQGEMYEGPEGEQLVRQAVDAEGMARFRAEVVAYHYPTTAQGLEQEKAAKIFDDLIDPAKALADVFFPKAAGESDEEKFEKTLMPHLRKEQMATVTDMPTKSARDYTRQIASIEYQKQREDHMGQFTDYRQSVKDKYRNRGRR